MTKKLVLNGKTKNWQNLTEKYWQNLTKKYWQNLTKKLTTLGKTKKLAKQKIDNIRQNKKIGKTKNWQNKKLARQKIGKTKNWQNKKLAKQKIGKTKYWQNLTKTNSQN